jgi:hypothetical protein
LRILHAAPYVAGSISFDAITYAVNEALSFKAFLSLQNKKKPNGYFCATFGKSGACLDHTVSGFRNSFLYS